MQNTPENQIQSLTNRGHSARSSCFVGTGMGSRAEFLPKGELYTALLCAKTGRVTALSRPHGYEKLKLCQRGNALGRV